MKHFITIYLSILLSSICNAQWTQSLGTESLNMQSLITFETYNLAGGSTGAYSSIDEAETYISSNTGNDPTEPTRGFAFDGTYIYTCTSQGVYRSSDNGSTWVQKNLGLTNLLTSGITYSSPYLIVVGPSGVFKSLDNGDNWTAAGLSGTDVRCVTSINDTLFVGTNGFGIYTSVDWGTNWTTINNGLSSSSNLRAIEAKGSTLFAGGQVGTGVFRSMDYGLNWTLLSGGLPNGSYRGFASNDSIIVAGSFGAGVFYSVDNGETWVEINSGLLDLTIFDLELNDNFIIAATDTKGVFRFPLSNIVLSVSDLIFNDSVTCYPNPANSTVWISSQTNLENISYKLIDIKGSLILSGKINGNKHEINIDALLNGVYFIHFDNPELAPFKLIKE